MCRYCEFDKCGFGFSKEKSIDLGELGGLTLELHFTDDGICAFLCSSGISSIERGIRVKTKFCPMCGRKLSDA